MPYRKGQVLRTSDDDNGDAQGRRESTPSRLIPDLLKLVVAVVTSTVTAVWMARGVVDTYNNRLATIEQDNTLIHKQVEELKLLIVPRLEHEQRWRLEDQRHADLMQILRDLQNRRP